MVQSFGKKNDAKNARVLKREGASYFRFARFIYVPTILSGSLAQAVRKLSVLQNKKWKKKKKKNVKKVGTQVQFFQHDQISDLRWPDNKKEDRMIKCIIAYPHKVT